MLQTKQFLSYVGLLHLMLIPSSPQFSLCLVSFLLLLGFFRVVAFDLLIVLSVLKLFRPDDRDKQVEKCRQRTL